MAEKKYFTGSNGWLWFWILFCWPIALYYWIKNKKTIKEIK